MTYVSLTSMCLFHYSFVIVWNFEQLRTLMTKVKDCNLLIFEYDKEFCCLDEIKGSYVYKSPNYQVNKSFIFVVDETL